jgi:phosphoribosylamine---glycine ligase
MILVVGGGAREHALARSLAADPSVTRVVAAPGNVGMPTPDGRITCELVDPMDGDAVAALAVKLGADLVVVGPEAPLAAGVGDAVRAAGIACFGPGAAAARLEASKAFAKQVMASAAVPTALAHVCTDLDEVKAALAAFGPPYVVKDDGLAAGKGVVVTDDESVAVEHAAACLGLGGPAGSPGRPDAAGSPGRPAAAVVIEEFLDGPEVSLFCLCDGRTVVPLEPAQDFKRVGDGDAGPNTGGMGAYSPLPWAPADLTEQVVTRVAQPVVDELAKQGTPFVGLLYCGLALTSRGVRVIEFNVRFGDPETQVVLARLETPLAGLLHAAAVGRLDDVAPLRWTPGSAVTVVLAAPGYPEAPRTGGVITGLAAADAVPNAWVLHAGTAAGPGGSPDATVVSAGGRVLSVVGTGADLAAARAVAYRALSELHLDGGHHRSDIAQAVAGGAAGA